MNLTRYPLAVQDYQSYQLTVAGPAQQRARIRHEFSRVWAQPAVGFDSSSRLFASDDDLS